MNSSLLVLRAWLRLLRIGLHLIWGCTIVLFVYPLVPRSVRLMLRKRWSGQALRIFGLRLQVKGQLMAHMRVSNHVSWLDIVIFNSIIPGAFIAKDDVRGWPLIGLLSNKTETYFMQRGSRHAAHRAAQHVANLLRGNNNVIAFPEGTTSRGDQVLPFYSALLQGAIDARASVQPVAIRYHNKNGFLSEVPAYYGDIGFGESIWRVACTDYLAVNIHFLPAIDSINHERRT